MIELYCDAPIIPCRAVVVFLEINRIPYKISIARNFNENQNESGIGGISRMHLCGKTIVMNDDGFITTGSSSILKYLCMRYSAAEHWCPKELHPSTRLDEYITWHCTNTAPHVQEICRSQVVDPIVKQIPMNKELLNKQQQNLEGTLDYIDQVFLRDQEFICGSQISIADLLAVCELGSLLAADIDICESSRVNLSLWMKRVQTEIQPHYERASQDVVKLRLKYLERQASRDK